MLIGKDSLLNAAMTSPAGTTDGDAIAESGAGHHTASALRSARAVAITCSCRHVVGAKLRDVRITVYLSVGRHPIRITKTARLNRLAGLSQGRDGRTAQ